jgi:hypothetical protein
MPYKQNVQMLIKHLHICNLHICTSKIYNLISSSFEEKKWNSVS